MSRYIDADKLKPTIHIYSDLDDNFHEKEYFRETYYTVEEIESAPTEEVQPIVHAYWKVTDTIIGKCCTCSNCGSCPTMEYRFCPYCGAKMDGKEE